MDEGAKVLDLTAAKVAFRRGAREHAALELEREVHGVAAGAHGARRQPQRRATAEHTGSDTAWRRVEALEQARRQWTPQPYHDDTLEELAALKLLTSAARRARTVKERMAAFDQISRHIDEVVRALRDWDRNV